MGFIYLKIILRNPLEESKVFLWAKDLAQIKINIRLNFMYCNVKKIIILSFFLLSACFNQDVTFPELKDKGLMDKKISADNLKSDLNYLVNRYKLQHPDWRGRVKEKNLDKIHKTLESRITEPMTRRDYFRLIGTITAKFRDGHTGVFYPYPELNRFIEAGGGLFPLKITLNNQLQGFTEVSWQSIPKGAEILTINEIPFSRLITDLSNYARGETFTLRTQVISKELEKWIWHIYNFADIFTVQYRYKGESHKTTLSGIQGDEIKRRVAQVVNKQLEYQRLNEFTGIINIDHFAMNQEHFRNFVATTLAQIKSEGIEHLIIDIRKNPGGSTDNVEYLLQYIIKRECSLVSQLQETDDMGEVKTLNYNATVKPKYSDLHYSGDSYLLIGEYTYSAAIVMGTAFKDCKVGVLLGQPTGGFANQTGQLELFNLPNTQLRAFMPRRLLLRPSGDATVQSLKPDVTVIEDRPGTIDRTIEKALWLTRQTQVSM